MNREIQDEVTELESKLHLIMEHDRIWNLKIAYSSVLSKFEEYSTNPKTYTMTGVSKFFTEFEQYLRTKLRELE